MDSIDWEDVTKEEYMAEIYDQNSDELIKRIDVFSTFEEALSTIDKNPLKDDSHIYAITIVLYDKTGQIIYNRREYFFWLVSNLEKEVESNLERDAASFNLINMLEKQSKLMARNRT